MRYGQSSLDERIQAYTTLQNYLATKNIHQGSDAAYQCVEELFVLCDVENSHLRSQLTSEQHRSKKYKRQRNVLITLLLLVFVFSSVIVLMQLITNHVPEPSISSTEQEPISDIPLPAEETTAIEDTAQSPTYFVSMRSPVRYHLSSCPYLSVNRVVVHDDDIAANGYSPCPFCVLEIYDILEPGLTKVEFENGELVKEPLSYDPRNGCPLDVSIKGDQSYYIFLDHISGSSHKDLSFLMKPGASVSLLVPAGEYEVYYITGSVWYGDEHFFGSESSFYKAAGIFDFYEDNKGSHGYTLELYLQENGNLETETINAADFPS